MPLGPFPEEGPNIEKVQKLIKEQGGNFDGHNLKHHKIYLSDPHRVKPENMRTVIRQPFF